MARRGRPPYPDVLTSREWEVLALLREGLSNEEIAARLGITLAGAKYHVLEILGKLGVESRDEAARWSAEGEQPRPWWATVFAPIGSAWRKISSGPLAALAAASVALLIAAGIALLVWGLLRTSGGGSRSVLAPTATALAATQPAGVGAPTPTAPAAAAGAACPGAPTAPQSSAPLLAYAAPDNTIWVVGADGKNPTQLICAATGSRNAAWSASGRYLAHVGEDGALHILDAVTGQDAIADDGTNGTLRYGPSSSVGYLQWSRADDSLIYDKFDRTDPRVSLGTWKVTPGTTPVRVIDASGAVGAGSPDGRRILYRVASDTTPTAINSRTAQLFIVNADGTNAHKLTNGLLYALNAWSPDSRLIAYWKDDHGGSSTIGDIYIMDIETEREVSLGQFTSDEHPQWSPDPNRDVFYNLAIDPQALLSTPLFDRPNAIINWSPDGTKVAYIEGPAFGGQSTLAVFNSVSRQTTTLHTTGVLVAHALGPGIVGVWSPDGRYYAYMSVDSTDGAGTTALYVKDLQSGTENRIWNGTSNDFGTVSTAYSPDRSTLLVQEGFLPPASLWVANADGSGLTKLADGIALEGGIRSAAWRPSR